MAVAWNEVNAAYLLSRAGFGPTRAEVEEFVGLGHEGAVSRLVDYEAVDNSQLEARIAALGLNLDEIFDLYYWWVYRMLYTARPLEEKMTLFWHGHFATSYAKVNEARFMYDQNQIFRDLAMGDFREMLLEVSRDPAMLIWLDNFISVAEDPNENYARELLELFSLGIGNYTEQDINEIARCFTGWTLREDRYFYFPGIHDDGQKVVFGNVIPAGRGEGDGQTVCYLCAEHPACAPFLANKLWRFFGAGDPPASVIAAMAAAYTSNSHSIREMVRTMFMADEFFARNVVDTQIKGPYELLVGSLRSLEASRDILEYRDARSFVYFGALMGQTLLLPPSVKGWDGGRDWINTSTLLARHNWANLVATLRGDGYQLIDPQALLDGSGATSAEEVVDWFAKLLAPVDLTSVSRQRLIDYMNANPDGSPGEFVLSEESIDAKVRGLVRLLLAGPEYQIHAKAVDPGIVAPVLISPVMKKGKLMLLAAGSMIQQGAVLRVTGAGVDGTQSIPLALNKKQTKWVVTRKAVSTPGGLTIEQLIPPGTAVTLVVENPDGGQSAAVSFSR